MGGVGPRIGFREGKPAEDFAPGQPRQIAPPLLLGAIARDGSAAQRVADADGHRERRRAPRNLLDDEGGGDAVEPGASVLLRDRHAQQPQLRQASDGAIGELLRTVQRSRRREDLRRHKLPHGLPDEALLLAQLEVHPAISP